MPLSLNLRQKLIILVLTMGLLPLIGTGFTVLLSQQQAAAGRTALQTRAMQIQIDRANRLVFAVVMECRGIYMVSNYEAAKPFADGLLRYLEELRTLRQQFSARDAATEGTLIDSALKSIDSFIAFRTEFVRMAREESITKARAFSDNDANRSNRQALNKQLTELAARFEKRSATDVAADEEWRELAFKVALASGALPVLGILFGFVIVTRGLSNPLGNIRSSIMALAEGNLNAPIFGAGRPDEIGQIARSVTIFRDKLKAAEEVRAETENVRQRASQAQKRATEEAVESERNLVGASLGAAIAKLATKDLTYRVTEQLPEGYRSLQQDFNSATSQLEEAVHALSAATDAIHAGGREIASASEDLSRRTEQQAASLEETAAALDQITATVRKTAEGTKHAREVVTGARSDAEHSGAVVHRAVQAMGKIERSSQEISQIIGVIDEIAFQTNLLALNAGVEAARAGDAGRGFAVVAAEVRALAQRSADAAKQIKTLITASSAEVGEGVKLVAETGETLAKIVTKVEEINGVVADIAASAQEQATGLQQVNTAVNEMDKSTQQNAAMAEQATAASRSLAQESDRLVGQIKQFHVGRGSTAGSLRTELEKVAPHVFSKPAGARRAGIAKAPDQRKPAATLVTNRSARASAAPQPANDEDWSEF